MTLDQPLVAREPPPDPLGERISLTFGVRYRDSRRRDRDQVGDIIGRWICRHARRMLPAYTVESWSCDVYPGQTYIGWWFGSVDVDLRRS